MKGTMMKLMTTLAVWAALLSSATVQANSPAVETFEPTIVKYDAPVSARDANLFYLADEGRVLRIDSAQGNEVATLKQAFVSGDTIRVEVAVFVGVDVVRSLKIVGHGTRPALSPFASGTERDFWAFADKEDEPPYTPTDVGTFEEANRIFRGLELGFRNKSQCYQRAMLWSHDMFKRNGVNSMKVFVFFTKKYIREYNYKWWFHVAPFVMAGSTEYVMDRSFLSKPLAMAEWTNNFIYSHQPCPTVAKYTDYSEHQEEAHCYLRKVPMFYYQPLNVQAMDDGTYDTTFSAWELDHAARARRGGWPF